MVEPILPAPTIPIFINDSVFCVRLVRAWDAERAGAWELDWRVSGLLAAKRQSPRPY